MRKFLISMALASATVAGTVAVPAVAQPARGWHHNGPTRAQVNNLLRDLNQAENRIERSRDRGFLSGREAVSLRREANQIRGRLNVASRNGINNREFAELRSRVNRLEQLVRWERRDRDGRRG